MPSAIDPEPSDRVKQFAIEHMLDKAHESAVAGDFRRAYEYALTVRAKFPDQADILRKTRIYMLMSFLIDYNNTGVSRNESALLNMVNDVIRDIAIELVFRKSNENTISILYNIIHEDNFDNIFSISIVGSDPYITISTYLSFHINETNAKSRISKIFEFVNESRYKDDDIEIRIFGVKSNIDKMRKFFEHHGIKDFIYLSPEMTVNDRNHSDTDDDSSKVA